MQLATTRRTRTLALLFALAAALVPASSSLADAPKEAPVVVHLGHFTDDLHAASMALSVATMLQKREVPVTLFLDREGVRLVDARVPQDLQWGNSASIEAKYTAFVDGGGTVLVCPHCAAAAGLAAKDLRPGATLGSEETIGAALAGASKVIDY